MDLHYQGEQVCMVNIKQVVKLEVQVLEALCKENEDIEEEEENDVEAPTEPSSDTKIYTMKSQIGHERTASERLAELH